MARRPFGRRVYAGAYPALLPPAGPGGARAYYSVRWVAVNEKPKPRGRRRNTSVNVREIHRAILLSPTIAGCYTYIPVVGTMKNK